MRLLITVASADGRSTDVVVDGDDDATVADLAVALDRAVVPAGRGSSQPPSLYLDSTTSSIRHLSPDLPLADSPIRHGSVLRLGAGTPQEQARHAGAAGVRPGPPEPLGSLEVRLTSGPGSGHVSRLVPGHYRIGPSPSADITLPAHLGGGVLPDTCVRLTVNANGSVLIAPDDRVLGMIQPGTQRRRPLPGPIVLSTDVAIHERKAGESTHAELPPGVCTLDPDAEPPLVGLDREPLNTATTWQPGQALVIGPCVLDLVETSPPDASLSLSVAGATLDYNRPPRLLPPERQTEFRLPAEPARPDKQPVPWGFMMMPLVLGPVMYLATGNALSLLMMAAMPLMMLVNSVSGRRRQKKKYKRDFAEYVQRTTAVQEAAFVALGEERAGRRRDHPDSGEALILATGPRSRLWERRRTDPDWLLVRVGTADQESAVAVRSGSADMGESAAPWTAPDVPVTVSLAQSCVTGIAGMARRPMARWILGQIATLHSPVDVRIVVLVDDEPDRPGVRSQQGRVSANWAWARWLPHLRSPEGSGHVGSFGVGEGTTSARIAELLAELDARSASMAGRDGVFPGPAIVVVLDGARNLRLVPGMVPLLRAGPRAGVVFVCLDEDHRMLPEECQAVVRAEEPRSVVQVSTREVVEAVRPDLVTTAWGEQMSRSIAAVRDVSAEDAAAAIPNASRLLTVLDSDQPTAESIVARWQQIGRSTAAVIGEQADGLFTIDLVRDGPHGLIAGTTGSGKSELLQTIIASLAADNRPDEMTFVLIDYKGGAAFKDCAHLPHTVGMVTDLDGHLTSRALESLGAELRRREHQLADADAKDIEDYLAEKRPEDAPMPRLVIVIDEFAALVAELPDFVTGLVDIARRGRSLGVHLILATQRPAGVVSAEIKSNTNLRIALRVTDTGDSQDVLDSDVAAQIAKSTPGRGYARLGHSSLTPFQSSRVGGRPRATGETATLHLRPLTIASAGLEPPPQVEGEESTDTPTDLTTLVRACRAASEASGIEPPPSPWLPALPEVLTLDAIGDLDPDGHDGRDARFVVPFGMTDVPSAQRRGSATYDLERGGHLAVIGAPRSGRSTVLRAIAASIARTVSPHEVHIYGVDCGSNALLPLVTLPHVGAVVGRDETDRMDRLIAQLRRTVTRRQQLLAEQGYADITEQRSAAGADAAMPYIVVLFDRWEGFFQAYDSFDGGRLIAAWQQVLQEGASAGVRVVMTGDRTLTTGRMSTLLDDKLMLRMVDRSDFSAVGLLARKVPETMPDGRGFRADGIVETHVAMLTDDPSGSAQVAALHQLGRDVIAQRPKVAGSHAPHQHPFRVDVLPNRVSAEQAAELGRSAPPAPDTSLPVAVGGDTLAIRSIDAVEHGPAALVTGPRRSGRSTTLLQLGRCALDAGWTVVVISPRVSPIRALTQHGAIGAFGLEADKTVVEEALRRWDPGAARGLVLVDDLELVSTDHWMSGLLEERIRAFRDTRSILVAAGSAADLASQYRGPAALLKKSGHGIMLSPWASQDGDMFGLRLNRSAYGAAMPPGGGYYVSGGAIERVQAILPVDGSAADQGRGRRGGPAPARSLDSTIPEPVDN